ncbi:putative stress response RCI peptide [Rosellinia necatrix]|uniref:Putative stress response RCI peptide n=1 Tax=Rosellinia necatrix TaxID=77044 RepID=A0A1W2TE96_ROSNE|nr:putative stress response RCI peptide [Rosellinia necatrix]
MCSSDIFLGVLAILFPPLAVWVKRGLCSADSLINILLCILGYIPGLLHAWYIIAKFPDEDDYERVPQDYESGHGPGGGRVAYVFVQAPHPHPHPHAHAHAHAHAQPNAQPQPKPGRQVNYGTASTHNNTSNDGAGAPSSSSAHHDEAGGSGGDGEHAPPTYAEAIKGDHKIQSDE